MAKLTPTTATLRRAVLLIRESLRNTERDYTALPMREALVLLAIPMMAEMAMESIFAIVDIFFVAKLGAAAVATVGLTEAMMTIVISLSLGVAMAATAMVARRVGEKDTQGASRAAVNALWIGFAISAMVGMLGWLYAPDLLRLMGADAETIAIGSDYTRIMMIGSGSLVMLFLVNAIFRGAGNAAIALYVLALANGINIVLDPLLIFGIGPFPELGVAGAAVATTTGRSCGVLLALVMLWRGSGRVQLRGTSLWPDFAIVRKLARLSAGGVGQFLIATTSWLVLIRIVALFGSNAVAGYTIAIRIVLFVAMPSWGLGNAAAALVGQYLGAKQPKDAVGAAWYTAKMNVIVMTAIAASLWLLGPFALAIFADEPAVMGYALDCLRIIALAFPPWAVGMILVQALNGAGDTDTPTLINFLCFWVLQIPLAWWLSQGLELGANGSFWAIAMADTAMMALAVWAFRRGKWQVRAL